jgi:diguanylate cyclase (GGDEF)-like protein
MRLTGPRLSPALFLLERPPLSAAWSWVAIAVILALVFVVDRVTAAAPFQHLYYVPIVLAGIRFGARGGLWVAMLAIVLYHLANPHVLTFHYEQSDFFQMAVFVAVGAIAAKLAGDARRLHRLAMTDDLTGLHNLRSFEMRMRSMIRHAGHAKTSLAVLVLDVDRLKSLNDAYGHLAGAEAVRTVGEVLATRLPVDSAACRYGGDEFVIALPQSARPEAVRVAEDLRRSVQSLAPVLAGVAFAVGALSISVGVASRTFENAPALHEADVDAAGEALFRAADAALYDAKRSGRNRIGIAE